MDINLLDNSPGLIWTILSSGGTILAAIAAIVYTCITNRLMKETSRAADESAKAAKASADAAIATADAAKATADAAKQNAIANELSVYLSLKKDLTTDVFKLVSKHCRLNTIVVVDSIATTNEYGVNNGTLTITQHWLTSEVLNNLEDLSIFLDKKVLTLKSIDEGYGYSILYIGNNKEIRRILENEKQNGVQSYTGFRNLYNQIYLLLDDTEKSKFEEFK